MIILIISGMISSRVKYEKDNRNNHKLMLDPHIQVEENIFYGYGIKIVDSKELGTYYYHNGAIPGFPSNITYIPSLQLTIICLTNTEANKGNINEIQQKRYDFRSIGQVVIKTLEKQT